MRFRSDKIIGTEFVGSEGETGSGIVLIHFDTDSGHRLLKGEWADKAAIAWDLDAHGVGSEPYVQVYAGMDVRDMDISGMGDISWRRVYKDYDGVNVLEAMCWVADNIV